MTEIKLIKGFDKHYVSTDGKIYSKHHNGQMVEMKTKLNNHGYEMITISEGYKIRRTTVHRLVAETFIPNPHGLSDVSHKNDDKTNNDISNLEWMTHKDNLNSGRRNAKISAFWADKTSEAYMKASYNHMMAETAYWERGMSMREFNWRFGDGNL
jgi:hypothetical protein